MLHSFVVPGLPDPDPPTNLQAPDITPTSAVVTWQPGANNLPPSGFPITVAFYELTLSESQFGFSDLLVNTVGPVTTFTFTGLEEFNTYTVTMRCFSTYETVSGPVSFSFITAQDGQLHNHSCVPLY